MEIMVTMPENDGERQALFQRAAQLHAEAICAIIGEMPGQAARKNAMLREFLRQKKAERSEMNDDS